MDWLRRRKQQRVLQTLLNGCTEKLPLLPNSRQDYGSDPLWQISRYSNASRFHDSELCKALESLISISLELKNVRVPVKSFYGSDAGKSKPRGSLREFAFEVMVPRTEERDIGFVTDDDWNANIRSFEGRFGEAWPDAYFFRWSSRLFLANRDQSHHLAAIYRQSIEQERDWHVPCNLQIYEVRQKEFCNRERGEILFFVANELEGFWDAIRTCDGLRGEAQQSGRETASLHAYRISGIRRDIFDSVMHVMRCKEDAKQLIRFERISKLLPKVNYGAPSAIAPAK